MLGAAIPWCQYQLGTGWILDATSNCCSYQAPSHGSDRIWSAASEAFGNILAPMLSDEFGNRPGVEFTAGEAEALRQALSRPEDIVKNRDRRFHVPCIS